jgi:hypothetical protein
MIGALLVGLFAGIWLGITIKTLQLKNNAQTERAVRVVRVTIDPAHQEELFLHLHKFADKWRYAIRIAPLDPRGSSFSVQLWRADMKVLGLYPNDPGTLDLGFFSTNPAQPVPTQYFDEEIEDLKIVIDEIPGATLSVE